MSGIIDKRSRILDSFVTQEGRRQIASGQLQPEYYSFSDAGAVYSLADTFISGTGDNTENIATIFSFEAGNNPHDQITFEADDSGGLVVKEFRTVNNQTIKVLNGLFFSGSRSGRQQLVASSSMQQITSSAEFSSFAHDLLSSSLDNFKNLYTIGSPDVFNDDYNHFEVSEKIANFIISDNKPIANHDIWSANIDHIESLFADKRLSHVPNFKFLPPVNKLKSDTNTTYPIGIFRSIGQQPIITEEDLRNEISYSINNGFIKTIKFTKKSQYNRLLSQIFEISGAQIKKLDVIDFGIFDSNQTILPQPLGADEVDAISTQKHVFFVGKVFIDSNGSQTFVNMFTLIFE